MGSEEDQWCGGEAEEARPTQFREEVLEGGTMRVYKTAKRKSAGVYYLTLVVVSLKRTKRSGFHTACNPGMEVAATRRCGS